jgi:hypothetical protein
METRPYASIATKRYHIPLALYLLDRPQEAVAFLGKRSNFEPVKLPGLTVTDPFGQNQEAEKDRLFVAALLALIEKER